MHLSSKAWQLSAMEDHYIALGRQQRIPFAAVEDGGHACYVEDLKSRNKVSHLQQRTALHIAFNFLDFREVTEYKLRCDKAHTPLADLH